MLLKLSTLGSIYLDFVLGVESFCISVLAALPMLDLIDSTGIKAPVSELTPQLRHINELYFPCNPDTITISRSSTSCLSLLFTLT